MIAEIVVARAIRHKKSASIEPNGIGERIKSVRMLRSAGYEPSHIKGWSEFTKPGCGTISVRVGEEK